MSALAAVMSEIVVGPLRSSEMSGAGLRSHVASLLLCIVAAMWSLLVVSDSEGVVSCRFEDRGTALLSVRDACPDMARRYLAMSPSGLAFAWPSDGPLPSTCVGGGSGVPERWRRVRSMASQLACPRL